MSILKAIILILAVLVYIILAICFIVYYNKTKKLEIIMEEKDDGPKLFYFEKKLLKKIHFDEKKAGPFLIIERIVLVISVCVILYKLRGLGMALVGSLIVSFIASDAYEKVIYESGITNIPKINNFINFFVPHINSGNSAEQTMIEYIAYSKDPDLSKWYENRENASYKPDKHVMQILDIYDVAKYNEEKGISDYTSILNEISKDYEQKEIYYNNYIGGIGEIKPTEWSYYLGVPFLIMISYSQTGSFWQGLGGVILSAVLLILFTIFKFLIYKLQKNTIFTIF